MSTLLKNTKMLGGAIIAVLVLILGYMYWGNSNSFSPTVSQAQTPASQNLLTTLSSLRAIQLNATIFSDPLFTSLSDFGVTIPSEPTGRGNPFAPAGVNTPVATSTRGH